MPDMLCFTSNTRWLEEVDPRRAESPEELLTRLEDEDDDVSDILPKYYKREKTKMNIDKKVQNAVRTPKPLLITNTGLAYLTEALAKLTDPLHPNFKRALKPDSLRVEQSIRAAAAR